jgi:cytochrome c oxidase subunit IV
MESTPRPRPEVQAGAASEATVHAGAAHVVPFGVLLGVLVALLALTVLTVAARSVDLGSWNIWIALAIATAKGSLVVLYFMHLRYDSPFNSLVFVTALVFMLLFLGITILDTIQYQPAIDEMLQAP